jgi:hypothetical protein
MTLDELTDKLKGFNATRDALQSSYDSIENWLFFFTALVVVGLVIEYRGGLKKLLTEWPIDWPHAATMIGAILVVIGVAGELLEEVRASSVEGKLQRNGGDAQQLLYQEAASAEGKIAKDDRIAKEASDEAGRLGVDLGNLHDFVDKKDESAKRLIAELRRDRDELAKESSEAKAADLSAKAQIAELRKEFGRGFTPKQRAAFIKSIRGKLQSVNIQSVPNDTGGYQYAMDIVSALKDADVNATFGEFSIVRRLRIERGTPSLLLDEFGEDGKAAGHALKEASDAAEQPAQEVAETDDPNHHGVAIIVAPMPPPTIPAAE